MDLDNKLKLFIILQNELNCVRSTKIYLFYYSLCLEGSEYLLLLTQSNIYVNFWALAKSADSMKKGLLC